MPSRRLSPRRREDPGRSTRKAAGKFKTLWAVPRMPSGTPRRSNCRSLRWRTMLPEIYGLKRLQSVLRALRREEIDVIGAFTAAAEAVLGGAPPGGGPAGAADAAASWQTAAWHDQQRHPDQRAK